ncbi:hypothetical protein [Clavibacter sp. MX14-G9D]|uniref:hypothetical protein n=1 Tax=Clavibacter sp. MX14-G9D TaxID=3064656 RepID=UPI00293E8D19|nr:hypothetical protein [Clavibacter sp. MX14-G9D]
MNTADPALDTRIRAFAAAVRARLADLDPEDVDDLTGGLEADLQEEAADHDGALELGDPVRYADELRSSAGLPERTTGAAAVASPLSLLRQRIDETGREMLRTVRANRELSAVLDLLIVFRPVWWLLRAWAGYQCALVVLAVVFGSSHPFTLLPGGPLGWLLIAALTLVSVQWGRGRWAGNRFLRISRTVVSVGTALSLLVLVPVVLTDSGSDGYVDESAYAPYEEPGLLLDGKAIANLFAYDADGELLDRVQLFDQDGEPVTTVSGIEEDGRVVDPTTGEHVSPADGAWNVFPLERDMIAVADGSVPFGSGVVRPPFAKALPLGSVGTATPGSAPSGDATTAPEDAPAEEPAPDPTPTPEPAP